MRDSRITIFAGHYGSGKTVLAVNYALLLIKTFRNVTLCDLDIVNPYFRAADFIPILKSKGINVLASDYANSNVDMPSVPAGVQAAFDAADYGLHTVVDLGGDDRGAVALGRYAKKFRDENGKRLTDYYQMFLVVNPFRPLTRGADELLEIKNEIESASGVRFTGIVNNPNLGADTSAEDIVSSFPIIEELSAKTGLPHIFTAVRKELRNDLNQPDVNIFPIEIFKKPNWKVD